MSSLYLQQVFWILVGVTVSAGIIRGIYHAVKRILGYSNDALFGTPEKMTNLGIIPVFLLEAGCSSWSQDFLRKTFDKKKYRIYMLKVILFVPT